MWHKAMIERRLPMTRQSTNRLATIIPLVCSFLALAIVVANVAAGTPPARDENASAHLFQLLMLAEPPFILLFAATAEWSRWIAPLKILALQAVAASAALACLGLAGY
jgi:hypothetical protein